ncbi:peptide-N(4)-(N-acetyl-beta-glucosaminyl)asparagine amidase [Saitoella complicata NRRL Y-17804]|nr:peptide-N(4)-(N-acetyl-beta-glucosaminyl)asparagine amidase [Saitoella complicata NRRL Y-17804]ODQ51682.1 peptide-N(4)-(N-acetyl-beta-glucosaminyl)asparagine amidase [Saitoella complicata NRRL Y-17804]
MIFALSRTPQQYESQTLQDRALSVIPLDRIYAEAEEKGKADSSWGHQDHVIRALMAWFKNDFFTWVNSPACSRCQGETQGQGAGQPTDQERRDGAGRTEVYWCPHCSRQERFPRYDHPAKLLETRRGRCGEWANCFTLLVRALGSRARWVWNAEDHVWTEVWSEKQGRWIHADSCENAWGTPKVYAEGWGKKMSYCIGFGVDSVQDVTPRYVRTESQSLPRNRGSEETLRKAIVDLNRQLRSHLPPSERAVLEEQDVKELGNLEKLKWNRAHADAIPTKTEELQGRQSGNAEWKRARGEDGKGPGAA